MVGEVKVHVELADPAAIRVRLLGLHDIVRPVLSVEVDSVTWPEKPSRLLRLTFELPEEPARIVKEPGLAEIAKSGWGGGLTLTVRVAVVLALAESWTVNWTV